MHDLGAETAEATFEPAMTAIPVGRADGVRSALAFARYRLLTSIRSGDSVMGFSVAAATLFLLLFAAFPNREAFVAVPELRLRIASIGALVTFVAHGLVLLGACGAFGAVRRDEDAPNSDLMDTVPVPPAARFWGDALGILGAVIVVHLCTLPLLALQFVLSTLPTFVFVRAELLLFAVLALYSTAASWTLRARNSRWSRTRVARSSVVFFILLLTVFILTTRWEDLRDAALAFMVEPSARTWAIMTHAVDNPLLFFAGLFVLYTGFIAWYYFHAVRSIENPWENS